MYYPMILMLVTAFNHWRHNSLQKFSCNSAHDCTHEHYTKCPTRIIHC